MNQNRKNNIIRLVRISKNLEYVSDKINPDSRKIILGAFHSIIDDLNAIKQSQDLKIYNIFSQKDILRLAEAYNEIKKDSENTSNKLQWLTSTTLLPSIAYATKIALQTTGAKISINQPQDSKGKSKINLILKNWRVAIALIFVGFGIAAFYTENYMVFSIFFGLCLGALAVGALYLMYWWLVIRIRAYKWVLNDKDDKIWPLFFIFGK